MGLDFSVNFKLPRARAKNSFYSIEIIYFRKCYLISRNIIDLYYNYKDDENFTTDWDGYLWRLNTSRGDASLAHPILYDIGKELTKTYKEIFENYPDEYPNDTIWDIGIYGKQIMYAINSISMFIMFMEKRISFEELIDALPLTEKEQEYINKYIIGHEEEWDFENLKVECYYSF